LAVKCIIHPDQSHFSRAIIGQKHSAKVAPLQLPQTAANAPLPASKLCRATSDIAGNGLPLLTTKQKAGFMRKKKTKKTGALLADRRNLDFSGEQLWTTCQTKQALKSFAFRVLLLNFPVNSFRGENGPRFLQRRGKKMETAPLRVAEGPPFSLRPFIVIKNVLYQSLPQKTRF